MQGRFRAQENPRPYNYWLHFSVQMGLHPAGSASVLGSCLVGGLEHFSFFHIIIGNVIIPTDELIFFRGVGIPPTSHALTFLESTAAAAELRGRRPGIPDPRMGRGQDGNHHPTGESRGD